MTSLVAALALCACTDDGGGDDAADGTDDAETTTDSTTGTDVGTDTTDATTDTTDATDTTTDTTTTDTTTTDTTTDATDTGGNAACMGAVAPAGTLAVGSPVSHWAGLTADGEEWDYCELGGQPFLLIISGGWCGPCQDLAAGLAGQASSWGAQLDPIRNGLEAGTLGVVDVLLDNFNDFDAATAADAAQWEAMFPNPLVHVLADPTPGLDGGEPLWQYLGPVHNGSIPSGILVDADFNVEVMGLSESISTASAKYGG